MCQNRLGGSVVAKLSSTSASISSTDKLYDYEPSYSILTDFNDEAECSGVRVGSVRMKFDKVYID